MPKFHNPYNFIPAPPLENRDGTFGRFPDRAVDGLDRFDKGWSGRLRVELTVETPLLLPDASRMSTATDARQKVHGTYPMRIAGPKGEEQPFIPPTAVKGAIRSAFEALTASRMAVAGSTRQPYEYREDRRKYLGAVPRLPADMQPISENSHLSPAERLFGSVATGSARAGRVRFGPIRGHRVETDDESRILQILGEPKPQQGRFYAASDMGGAPLENGTNARDFYTSETGIRGRKMYLHHPQFDEQAAITSECSDQNRTVVGAVLPPSVFAFDLHLMSVLDADLGALLVLLSGSSRLRLGYGRPLGFGSIKPHIDTIGSDLSKASDARDRWASLTSDQRPLEPADISACKRAFVAALVHAVGERDAGRIVQAFKNISTGPVDGERVTYPVTEEQFQSGDEGERFKWFVANDRGPKVSLPDASTRGGLPPLSALRGGRQPGGGGDRQGSRRRR